MTPLLATAAIITVNCKGVISVYPWPMDKFKTSPVYHDLPAEAPVTNFPLASKGKSTPVGRSKPNALAKAPMIGGCHK